MIDIVGLGEILIDFTPNGINEQGIALFARNPGHRRLSAKSEMMRSAVI